MDTRQFLESEANRLELNLAEIESKISIFKEKNVGVLPEHQEINLQAYQRVEQQIADIDRSLASLNERRIIIEAGIDTARRFIASSDRLEESEDVVNPIQNRLNELESEYSEMKTRYSEVHPDLKKLEREIASVKERLTQERESTSTSASEAGSTQSEQQDAAIIRLNTDLRTAISEQTSLRRQREQLFPKLSALESKINQSPEIEREYKSLVRDYENVQDKYNDIRTKQNSARVSESLEIEQKGERFTLIEPPRLPLTPYSPNTKKLAVAMFGFAGLAGLGAALGVDKLQGKIRNPRALEAATKVPTLASIGYIKNRADNVRVRTRRLLLLLLLFALIFASLIVAYQIDFKLENIDLEMLRQQISELLNSVKKLIQ